MVIVVIVIPRHYFKRIVMGIGVITYGIPLALITKSDGTLIEECLRSE